MEFKVKKSVIGKIVSVLETITPSKSIVPVLSNIKITVTKSELVLSATDLEVGIQYKLTDNFETIKEGEILLPAKKFSDTLAGIDDDQILIKDDGGNCLIRPTYESDWFYKFLSIDPASFPQFPKIEKGASSPIELGLVDFKDMVNKISFSVSDGVSNYALSGICLEVVDNEFRMASTDGVRLSLVKRSVIGEKIKPFKAIVPVKATRLLEKIAENEKMFYIYFDNATMQIKLSNGFFFTRLIEGTFPDYEGVIPTSAKKKIIVPLQQFVSRLRTILVFASERAKTVKLILKKNSLQLYTTSSETGEAFTKEVPVEYTGENFSIVLNPDFLSDVCRVINDNNLYMELNDEASPVVIKEKNTYTHLIMPISTQ